MSGDRVVWTEDMKAKAAFNMKKQRSKETEEQKIQRIAKYKFTMSQPLPLPVTKEEKEKKEHETRSASIKKAREKWTTVQVENQKNAVKGFFKNKWKEMTKEQKEEHLNRWHAGRDALFAAMTPEEKQEHLKNARSMYKVFWEELPDDEKKEKMRKLKVTAVAAWNKMSIEEQRDLRHKASNVRPTSLEVDVRSLVPPYVEYVGDRRFWVWTSKGAKNPDFIVHPYMHTKMVIEAWGDYWHRDHDPQEFIALYAAKGVKCLLIWEKELEDPVKVKAKIDAFLEPVRILGEANIVEYRKRKELENV